MLVQYPVIAVDGYQPLLFARGIWCKIIVVEVVVFSSMNLTLHSIVEVATEKDEELKARTQTKTMPYRVSDRTVGTVGQLAREERSRFQQDPSVRKRQRIYISGDAQHAALSRLSESVKQRRCTVSWACVDAARYAPKR
jgi:hypothetical protein